MGWFSKSKSCEDVGAAVAEQCLTMLKSAPTDNEARFIEFFALTIIAHRLGMQFTSLPRDKKSRVVTAFDQTLGRNVDLAGAVGDLLDKRGEQYFGMFNDHVDEINRGNWRPFADELSFRFEQFCLGGGEKDAPVVIGDMFSGDIASNLTLGLVANKMFAESFGGARNAVSKHNPT